MSQLTHTATLEAIRSLNMVPRCVDGEYRVAYPLSECGGDTALQERSAYYTTDRADAVGTAKFMRGVAAALNA